MLESVQVRRARPGWSGGPRGKFDIDFSASTQDPSPSGLVQSWTCKGSHQRRLGTATPRWTPCWSAPVLARDDPRSTWHEVLRRIEADAPATFMYSQTYAFVVNRRFRDVAIRPESSWISRLAVEGGHATRRGRRGKLSGALAPAACGPRPPRPSSSRSPFSSSSCGSRPAIRSGGLQEGESLTPEARAVLERMYGIDRPLPEQFVTFLRGVARGDLGSSIGYGLPVTTLIGARLPATLLLGGTVLLLNFTLGLWLGVRQAVRRGRAEDRVLSLLSLACYATPSFWLGLMLAWLFAIEWRVLPSGGLTNPLLDPSAGLASRVADLLSHLILPAVTLSIVTIAATMRYQRTAMLEVLRLPYIVTARAKGLPESRVTGRHAWRNALFPVITIFGLWLPILVTGSVFVE